MATCGAAQFPGMKAVQGRSRTPRDQEDVDDATVTCEEGTHVGAPGTCVRRVHPAAEVKSLE